MSDKTVSKRIAIVGLGPKGLYGLERLLANIAEEKDPIKIDIHLFDRTDSFGAGAIYNPNQPSYLLMNYANGYINAWPEQSPEPVVKNPKSFVDWLEEHREEFPDAKAHNYSSRGTVGRYLSGCFNELIKACPEQVSIVKHVGDVLAIEKDEEDYTLVFRDTVTREINQINTFQNILVATGHPCINEPESLTQNNRVDFIYPVNHRLDSIAAGSTVAIKGMGLTFIDAVLALTEGRNGKFENNPDGSLSYLKSGLEPKKIYPFSTSGLPMIPRGNTFGNDAYEPLYFREELLEYLDPLDGKYDFERELLPLIKQEFSAVYYDRKFKENGQKLVLSRDFTQVQFQIESFHEQYPQIEKFDFQSFLKKPIADNNLNQNTMDFINYTIHEAELGVKKSAFAAAADLWRHLSDFFNERYKFGGLKPQSQRIFLEKYAGHLNRITYGPPIENMRKVLAIAEAGLIDFSFSQNPRIGCTSHFLLAVDRPNQQTVETDFLVDARIPKIKLQHCPGELYESMLEKGLIFPYMNRQEGLLDFKPGCLAINEHGHPLDETGFANPALTFVGTPTEGLTYDNDTLSRKRNDFVSGWAKSLLKDKALVRKEQLLNSNLPL